MIDHGSRSTWGPGPSGSGFRAQKYDPPPLNHTFPTTFVSYIFFLVSRLRLQMLSRPCLGPPDPGGPPRGPKHSLWPGPCKVRPPYQIWWGLVQRCGFLYRAHTHTHTHKHKHTNTHRDSTLYIRCNFKHNTYMYIYKYLFCSLLQASSWRLWSHKGPLAKMRTLCSTSLTDFWQWGCLWGSFGTNMHWTKHCMT